MNDEDREKIIANCDKLISAINWNNIFPRLIERGIYHQDDDRVQRWQANLDLIDNNREIYLGLRTGGPKAFASFVQCLKDIGQQNLADILKLGNNEEEVRNDDNRPVTDNRHRNITPDEPTMISTNDDIEYYEDDYYTRLRYTKEPLKVRVIKSDRFITRPYDKVMSYAMTSKPRGLVLIINNVEFRTQKMRHGTQHDERNLKDLFDQMGFKVVFHRDLTAEAMLEEIKMFSQRPDLRHVHSMFCVIMSHGSEFVSGNRSETIISGVDGKFVTEREILNNFTATACKNMCKKPKVFIFQTCRGNQVQRAVNVSNVSTCRHSADVSVSVEPSFSIEPISWRDYSDMLVAYSTLPGHESYRDEFTGSWYIQILCEVIMNHAHNTELSTMLQMADDRLASMRVDNTACQTSEFRNFGFKKCYLNPGLFETTNDT